MDVELDANVTSTESGFVIGPPEPQSCPGGRYDFAPTSFPNSLRLGVEFDRRAHHRRDWVRDAAVGRRRDQL